MTLDKMPSVDMKIHEFLTGMIGLTDLAEVLTLEEIIPDEEITNMDAMISIVYTPNLEKLHRAVQLAAGLYFKGKIQNDAQWDEFAELLELT